MTILEEFSRRTAKRFLQSVVFVDDEIYDPPTGQPIESSKNFPPMKSPFRRQPGEALAGEANDDGDREWTPYHPKQMVESFAREGIVCALYEPEEKFGTDRESVLFKLCDRADVVILDWDLFSEDGRNILPLIRNLVDESQSSVPHHVRLCVIYSAKPDLSRVTNQIYADLGGDHASNLEVKDTSTIVAGATRITVFGKPNVTGRNQETKALEVEEPQLAGRVIDEFAKMNAGLLASYALHGLAAVRRNTKRVVDKFGSEMDGPFLIHRALTLQSEDAFDQLPELLSEELFAVIQDEQIKPDEMRQFANASAQAVPLDAANLNWPSKDNKPARKAPEFARMFLAGGEGAVAAECVVPKKPAPQLHEAMGCAKTKGDKRLAALFNTRTKYASGEAATTLEFGTIVRYKVQGGEDRWVYACCMMPICDGIRLKNGDGQETAFPFWDLVDGGALPKGRGIMLELPDQGFVHLVASGKPRENLWMGRYKAGGAGVVTATSEHGRLVFDGERRLEWVAQLKPSHAQRVAHDIGQHLSRVGVMEAEWFRILSERKD